MKDEEKETTEKLESSRKLWQSILKPRVEKEVGDNRRWISIAFLGDIEESEP